MNYRTWRAPSRGAALMPRVLDAVVARTGQGGQAAFLRGGRQLSTGDTSLSPLFSAQWLMR